MIALGVALVVLGITNNRTFLFVGLTFVFVGITFLLSRGRN